MITFRKRTLWESTPASDPVLQKKQDREVEEAIRTLMDDPWLWQEEMAHQIGNY